MIAKKLIIKRVIILLFSYMALALNIVNAKTFIKGEIIAGGIIIVNVSPGSTVKLNDESIMISDKGVFLVGFERKPQPTQILEIYNENVLVEKITLNVKIRSYEIQRINGINKDKVDPPQSVIDRIYMERNSVKESRKKSNLITSTYYNNGFVLPAKGPISGVYGSQRILNGKPRSPHYGIDIALPKGHEVVSPMDGIVVFSNNDLYYSGGTIIIAHGQGLTTSYLHLSEILVSVNDIVRRGELIGKVGATGRATGPHLHWGAELKGKRIDPKYLDVFN
ncbi:MAG: M23 family metallopeptidase [Alphaproteobacteria bacterium]|nr:M23 family metallopeptidase [Alphaproteobacteria bacterium]